MSLQMIFSDKGHGLFITVVLCLDVLVIDTLDFCHTFEDFTHTNSYTSKIDHNNSLPIGSLKQLTFKLQSFRKHCTKVHLWGL